MIYHALTLSATGIGFVFIFLSMLVLMVKCMSAISLHITPTKPAETAVPNMLMVHNKQQAALAAASAHHYRSHTTGRTS